MTTTRYIVIGGAGVNMRTYPSSSYPTAAPVKNLPKGTKLDVIADWTAVNTVGSETVYLPVLADGKVYYCTKELVEPYDASAHVLEVAKSIGDYMVKNGYRYRYNGEAMSSTFAKSKSEGRKGCTCTRYVSWVLQQAGHLKNGKLIGHDLSGKEYLVDCKVIKAGKSMKSLLAAGTLKPGDIIVSDKNTCGYNACCIVADTKTPKFYEAGGPFKGTSTVKSAPYKYTAIGPIKVNYDATLPKVEYIIRPY